MPWQQLANVLWYVNIACTVLLVLRLYTAGLISRLRWFTGFLVYALARAAVISFAGFTPAQYFPFFVITESLLWLFYLMILFELYDHVLAGFPGIRSLGTWATLSALAVSLTAAVAAAWPAIKAAPHAERYTETLLLFLAVERGVLFGLAALILMMSIFLIWFPIPLARNVVFHSFLFAIYFLSKAMTLLFRGSTGAKATPQVTAIILGVAAASLIGWIILLRRSGETTPVVMGHGWDPAQEDRLIRQLKEVNRVLVGTNRD